VENGFSAASIQLEDLLHALIKDAGIPPRRLRSEKYLNVALMVINEVGFRPTSRQEMSLLLRLVSNRYERGSILITTK
jgi:DNA replication protein DnaC